MGKPRTENIRYDHEQIHAIDNMYFQSVPPNSSAEDNTGSNQVATNPHVSPYLQVDQARHDVVVPQG